MVYAIIHTASDYEEMVTVAYGNTAGEVARWFIDELNDTAQMYLSDDTDFEKLDEVAKGLEIFAEADADCSISDLDGITAEIGGISAGIVGAYFTYEDMKKGLSEFLSDKPSYKKVTIPDNEYEEHGVIDTLNAALIRAGL